MAFTNTLIRQSIMSNQRVVEYNVTADAQSGTIAPPLGVVDCVFIGPISMNTAGIKFKINLNGASAASNGNILVSGCTAGDNFFVVIYGRS